MCGLDPDHDVLDLCRFILSAIKTAAGGSSQLSSYEKKLAEPFDPYAD